MFMWESRESEPEVIVGQVHLPAGVAGPSDISFDVRCFLLPHHNGFVLIDTGMGKNTVDLHHALERMGAGWDDISDVVITHAHPDHIGGLNEVLANAKRAQVWVGEADADTVSGALSPGAASTLGPASADVLVRAAEDGAFIGGLRVIHTPGHTPGHLSLLHEGNGLLFVGDSVGTMNGVLVRPPAPFTADPKEAEVSLRKLAEISPQRMLFSHGGEIDHPNSRLSELLEGSTPA